MENINKQIEESLKQRKDSLSLRELSLNSALLDFCSNDYLGFSRSPALKESIELELLKHPSYLLGSTGSRLISGNHEFTQDLELRVAHYHVAEAALLFNSGYDANLGIFSSLARRGDTIILDELSHSSIIDGSRLSYANRYNFKHNDLNSLEKKLKLTKGNTFIGVESIYSMDGDEAPLAEIANLAQKYSAALIVDEAHAVGIFGSQGEGLVEHYGLQEIVFARVVTFGKALGCHGAAIVGSKNLCQYLSNFARSFIYTTAAPFHSHLSVMMAYNQLQKADLTLIHNKIRLFKEHTLGISCHFVQSNSPIQSLIFPGNARARKLASTLQQKGYNVRAILHPTVPAGKERLRICLHAFNTDEDILNLAETLKDHI